MSRRIDVELTSDRGDGTWTWRAAGAKQPKGELDGSLLPDGAAAGDLLRAEADFDIDGITIISVAAPKAERAGTETLEILGSGREPEGVTTSLVDKKGRGKGRGRRRGKGRGGRRGRDDRDDRSRSRSGRASPPPPERPKKPKPPRLRPKRTHRDAALAEVSDAERPVGEQVLKGGIPAVRAALEAQNEENEKAGRPPVAADAVVGLAEQLLPRLKAAEWHDRAEAAVEQMEKVDLRDLRSVVTAADASARDDETRALAEQLRTGLAARVEHDHGAWLQELAETLADGRVARALNLSSRPPKAGAPLPRDLADRLAAAASAGLTSEVGQKRWQTVLESVARSPVRRNVIPEGLPSSPNDELLETVRNVSMQVPQIAAAFGIEPQRSSRKRRRPRRSGGSSEARGGRDSAKKAESASAAKPGSGPRIPPPPDLPAEQTKPRSSESTDRGAEPVPAPDAQSETPSAEGPTTEASEAVESADADTGESAAATTTQPDSESAAAEAPAGGDASDAAASPPESDATAEPATTDAADASEAGLSAD